MSQLLQEIESLRQPMKELNDFIFDHPELGNEEFQAHELLTNLLEKEDFTVDREVSGLKTAFRAVYHVNGGGPKIGHFASTMPLKVWGMRVVITYKAHPSVRRRLL